MVVSNLLSSQSFSLFLIVLLAYNVSSLSIFIRRIPWEKWRRSLMLNGREKKHLRYTPPQWVSYTWAILFICYHYRWQLKGHSLIIITDTSWCFPVHTWISEQLHFGHIHVKVNTATDQPLPSRFLFWGKF